MIDRYQTSDRFVGADETIEDHFGGINKMVASSTRSARKESKPTPAN
jgi:hypothetical protein